MLGVAIGEDDFRVAAVHEEFLLKIEGVKVVGKGLNAKETIGLLNEKAVDLLLLDIYMPDRLGTDLLQTIRRDFPKVDIIMITAAIEKDLVEISLRNGVFDYIIKPVTMKRFIDTIENYREKHELLEKGDEINQNMIDQYLGHSNVRTNQIIQGPKGIDPLTLQKVKQILETVQQGISAEQMGEKLGASRITARRYLEYLTSIGEGKAELEYGIVGRPERKYSTKKHLD